MKVFCSVSFSAPLSRTGVWPLPSFFYNGPFSVPLYRILLGQSDAIISHLLGLSAGRQSRSTFFQRPSDLVTALQAENSISLSFKDYKAKVFLGNAENFSRYLDLLPMRRCSYHLQWIPPLIYWLAEPRNNIDTSSRFRGLWRPLVPFGRVPCAVSADTGRFRSWLIFLRPNLWFSPTGVGWLEILGQWRPTRWVRAGRRNWRITQIPLPRRYSLKQGKLGHWDQIRKFCMPMRAF